MELKMSQIRPYVFTLGCCRIRNSEAEIAEHPVAEGKNKLKPTQTQPDSRSSMDEAHLLQETLAKRITIAGILWRHGQDINKWLVSGTDLEFPKSNHFSRLCASLQDATDENLRALATQWEADGPKTEAEVEYYGPSEEVIEFLGKTRRSISISRDPTSSGQKATPAISAF